MDTWRSRIEKRSLSAEKSREPTIFLRADNSLTHSKVLKVAELRTKVESIR